LAIAISRILRPGSHVKAKGGYDCLSHRKEGGRNRIANSKGGPMPPCNLHGAMKWALVHID